MIYKLILKNEVIKIKYTVHINDKVLHCYLSTASTEPPIATPAPLSNRTPLMSSNTPLIFLLVHDVIVTVCYPISNF